MPGLSLGLGLGLNRNKGVGDPTLLWDLDFTAQAYRYNRQRYASVTDLPATTFTRATTGFGVNVAGQLVSFASGSPRITDAGLTVEAAATNLATQSRSLDNAAWTKVSGNTVTANAAAGPDGVAYLDKLVEISGTTDHQIWRGATITADGIFTSSIIAKSGERTAFRLQCEGGTTNGPVAHFDLSTGVVSNTGLTGASAGASFIAARMTPLANGCWLCEVTGTVGTGDTVAYLHVKMIKAGSVTYAGNGTDGMYFGDGQIEMGSFATSRIVTTTAAATRNADVLVSNDNAPAAYTEVVSFTPRAVNDGATHHVLCLSDGTHNNRVTLAIIANGHLVLNVVTAGAVQASLDLGLLTAGVSYKCAFRIAANDVAASLAGAAVATDLTVAVPATTLVHRGMWLGGGEALTGELRTRARYSVGKTNAELQALSA